MSTRAACIEPVDRPVFEAVNRRLSGGQRQRVGIARALATRPPVLLCDEPTSALDSDTTRQILELLRSLRDRLGITIVIITHEPSVVREVCDAVTLLDNGAIAESGSLLDVVTDPDSRLAHSLIPLPPHQPSSSARLLEVSLGGDSSFAGAADVLHALRQAGIEAEIAAATLETISGRRVGRLQLDLPSLEQRDAARELLGAHGIDTEVAA